MPSLIATTLLMIGLMFALGIVLIWASRRFHPDPDALVDALDALLPQTQCALCGYPGCRPYAQAMADGEAINLCPPGGAETHQALGDLLASSAEGRDVPPTPTPHYKAVIDEARCIGCYLCIQACPVDAIVGAHKFMHTVIEETCTGCELCIAPCPVDCIDLVKTSAPNPEPASADEANACIRCGLCVQACPVDLLPQELLWHTAARQWDVAADKGMGQCIECGLCNPVCPSNIDLVGHFRAAKTVMRNNEAEKQAARQAGKRYTAHATRLALVATKQTTKRNERLKHANQRKWST